MTDRPPLPPFDRESAVTKVQAAEDAWNTRDPERVAGAYTVEYRIYFEMNSNIYTGVLIKDGTVESTAHYRTNPSSSASTKYLDYNVRLNGAAMHSLVAGSLL